jgi:biotin carboxylase
VILLLASDQSYRERAFREAAERLGVPVALGVDRPRELGVCGPDTLALDFDDLEAASHAICAFAAERPLAAILALDDSGSLLAAQASAALGLPHNAPEAAEAARDKHLMRQLMARAGVPVPSFLLCSSGDDFVALAGRVPYPCVLKPTMLNGSRGVIRADTPAEFVAAAERLRRLLDLVYGEAGPKPFLVESFIPGVEVAIEGMLENGALEVLALFDKPDPLDGPFFEETLYVTPSRLAPEVQRAIVECAERAARALGLARGPLHGELRVNDRGPWVVEVQARSIGGQCSRTLRFGSDASLEELILRAAVGLPTAELRPQGGAGGVMMIPIPGAGLLSKVEGLEAARAVAGVEEVTISAPLHYPLVPLPEGESYLGFIFARGATPAEVEAALREAHARLRFELKPHIGLSLS